MSKSGPYTKSSPARTAALKVGTTVRTRKAYTQELISSLIDSSPMSSEDRAFATRLALGVTSSYGTLDEIIDRFLKPGTKLEPELRDALRISSYEILFLGKTAHAAVDQGVELVKSINPKASGLANAVLRKIVLAQKEFPFGDPQSDSRALARLHAFPYWMTELLIKELGYSGAELFMKASNEPAPVFLAVNTIKLSDESFETLMAEDGILVKKMNSPEGILEGCYRLLNSRDLLRSEVRELFDEGKILVSDAASQMVASLVLPREYPELFLEIGSGRGTKTILIQSNAYRKYDKQVPLQALDNKAFKIKLLSERMKRYGVLIDAAYDSGGEELGSLFPSSSVPAVFIDTPCSGLGTLRRHPEIRWRISASDISGFAERSLTLLSEAASRVAVGGLLSFSSCTVVREENEGVVNSFLKSKIGSSFSIVPVGDRKCLKTMLSPGSSDAHFAVRMLRQR